MWFNWCIKVVLYALMIDWRVIKIVCLKSGGNLTFMVNIKSVQSLVIHVLEQFNLRVITAEVMKFNKY